MDIGVAERTVRVIGFVALGLAWFEAGRGMVAGAGLRPGRTSGLATRFGILPAYLIIAVPYFTICGLLWRPLPGAPATWVRVVLLAAGSLMGFAGIGLYVWGRRTLGKMYNLTGTLGAQLREHHELITAGPYARVRHPMFLGVALGALGGLAVYRVWTFVFVLGAIPGTWLRARKEEALLAAEFGSLHAAYRDHTPAWLPRLGGRTGAPSPGGWVLSLLRSSAAAVRRRLPRNLGVVGRLIRGALAAGAGYAAFGVDLPVQIRILLVVVMVSSVLSVLTGYCPTYHLIEMARASGRRNHD